MNRTGLIVALSIAAVVGIVFAIWPQLDIAIGALFYNPATHSFAAWYSDRVEQARDAASLLITLCVVPAVYLIVASEHHAAAPAGDEPIGSHAPAT